MVQDRTVPADPERGAGNVRRGWHRVLYDVDRAVRHTAREPLDDENARMLVIEKLIEVRNIVCAQLDVNGG